ncbi:MAG TPA: helix-turn-helix domain-containing protein [Microvirga sp.]|jgi:hypothetical protein
MDPSHPYTPALVIPVNDARRLLGNIGRTKFYELINGGHVRTITIGRRRLVFVDSIYRFLEQRAIQLTEDTTSGGA